MKKEHQFPPFLMAKAINLFIKGRVHFEKDCIETIEHREDEDFIVFRKIVVTPSSEQPEQPGALFSVCFRFARFSFRVNRILSLIPIPFIIAQPGFRSKTWMTGLKTGAFIGVYEWNTVEQAKDYLDSFPLRLMKRRAIPETLEHEIRAL